MGSDIILNVVKVAFGAVIVLTMLSAMSFDPRLIWDRAETGNG